MKTMQDALKIALADSELVPCREILKKTVDLGLPFKPIVVSDDENPEFFIENSDYDSLLSGIRFKCIENLSHVKFMDFKTGFPIFDRDDCGYAGGFELKNDLLASGKGIHCFGKESSAGKTFRWYAVYKVRDRALSIHTDSVSDFYDFEDLLKGSRFIPMMIDTTNSVILNHSWQSVHQWLWTYGANIKEDAKVMTLLSEWISNGGYIMSSKKYYVVLKEAYRYSGSSDKRAILVPCKE